MIVKSAEDTYAIGVDGLTKNLKVHSPPQISFNVRGIFVTPGSREEFQLIAVGTTKQGKFHRTWHPVKASDYEFKLEVEMDGVKHEKYASIRQQGCQVPERLSCSICLSAFLCNSCNAH